MPEMFFFVSYRVGKEINCIDQLESDRSMQKFEDGKRKAKTDMEKSHTFVTVTKLNNHSQCSVHCMCINWCYYYEMKSYVQ